MKKSIPVLLMFLLAVILTAVAGCASRPETAITIPAPGGAEERVDSPADREIPADSPAGPEKAPSSDESASSDDRPVKKTGELKGEAVPESAKSIPMMEFGESYPAPLAADRSYGMESGVSPAGPPTQSGLKAGYSDDNKQYGYYLRFLEEYGSRVRLLGLEVSERITLTVQDRAGKPIPNVRVIVADGVWKLSGQTLADGTWQFNPSDFSPGPDRAKEPPALFYPVQVIPGTGYTGKTQILEIDRNGPRNLTVTIDAARVVPDPIPMDIVFVMDTTGSMGEEIQRLKNTIQIIHMNLSSLSVSAEIRFGMVLYKDVEDEYRTRVVPLTGDLDLFQAQLDEVYASGGGDTPEDLEAALYELVNTMEWNPRGIRLSYIITDAPPHLDYQSAYTLEDAAREARSRGIRIYGIGTGGLDLQGEMVLRQLAQYTSGRYIFLTYGSETGESDGGVPGSVSHHTGTNWNADKLETIIIRFAREELSFLSDTPLKDEDPWFEAGSVDTETSAQTLAALFDQALEQLLDFSTFPVTKEVPLAVLPFLANPSLLAQAEYFTEHFVQAAGLSERISLAERKDIGQILAELEFQNTGLTQEGRAGEIGALLNAQVLVTGNLFGKGDGFELFLKLIRTETGEVLSVTRAVMTRELGL